jgi:hypothetical protein
MLLMPPQPAAMIIAAITLIAMPPLSAPLIFRWLIAAAITPRWLSIFRHCHWLIYFAAAAEPDTPSFRHYASCR